MAVQMPRGNDRTMDAFNDHLRANPEYRRFLQSMGVNPDGPIRLSGPQRTQAEQWVRSRFQRLPGKFQVDPAGNVNTDHGVSTAWSNPAFRYPLIAGGAALTAGLINPALVGLGGAGGAGGGAGAGAAGTLASSSLPTAALMGGPAAIASQGISAGIPFAAGTGALAARHLPTAALMGGPPNIASQGISRGIPWGGVLNTAVNAGANAGGGSLLGKVLTGLKNYGPLAAGLGLAAIPALKGLFGGDRGPTDADKHLNDILGLAKNRITGAEPLYQQLLAGAGDDANLARSRTAQGAPILQALTAMANAQMPDYTKNRG